MDEKSEGKLIHIIAGCFFYLLIAGITTAIFNPDRIYNSTGIPTPITQSIIHILSMLVVINFLLRSHFIDFSKIGFTRKNLSRTLLLGISTGLIIGLIQYHFGVVMGITEVSTKLDIQPAQGIIYILAFVIMGSCIIPIFEEIIFRGIFYPVLKSKYNFVSAVVIITFLWVVVHMPSSIGLAIRFCLVSCLLVYVYERGSLGPAIIAHGTGNAIWYISVYFKSYNLI